MEETLAVVREVGVADLDAVVGEVALMVVAAVGEVASMGVAVVDEVASMVDA